MGKRNKVTTRDIAEYTGVSQSSVDVYKRQVQQIENIRRVYGINRILQILCCSMQQQIQQVFFCYRSFHSILLF